MAGHEAVRMSKIATSGLKTRLTGGVAAAVLAIGLPSAGLAIGLLDSGENFAATDSYAAFTPASADPRMARLIEARTGGKARMMRFTPAGASSDPDRAVTVAVRIDGSDSPGLSVRSAINSSRDSVAGEGGTRIASTRYNLGLARGYKSFAQAPALSQQLSTARIPDLSEFEPTPGPRSEASRFAARIALEEGRSAASTAPETLDIANDQSLDVAGSYRLTRNFDVTAGVRYEQQRDRVAAMPNVEQQDSQAVYVGTQFRF